MRLRIRNTHVVLIGLLSALSVTGCAQRKAAVLKDDAPSQNAVAPSIKAVKVSEDGSRLEISLNQPVTYTFYKINEPLKAVIDFAQVEFTEIERVLEVNKGIISKYELTKQNFGSGNLARLEIYLKSDGEFTVIPDVNDKTKLMVSFTAKAAAEEVPVVVAAVPVSAISAASEPIELKPVTLAEPEPAVKLEPVPKVEMKELVPAPVTPVVDAKDAINDSVYNKLISISVGNDGVDIIVDGKLSNYNAFKLTKPERLVVDLFGIKSNLSSNVAQINSFGINQARVGLTQDKLRIVFDSSAGDIPPYHLEKTDKGLKIVLEKVAPVKPEEVKKTVEVVANTREAIKPTTPVVSDKVEVANSSQSKNAVDAIDFKLVDGYSQILISTGKGCRVGKVLKTTDGLSLTINNCQLPKNLQRFVDTSSFASVVKGITPIPLKTKRAADARFVVKLRADAPYRLTQANGVVNWEIKNTEIPSNQEKLATPTLHSVSPAALKVEERELGEVVLAKSGIKQNDAKKQYSGRKVTLEFSDADVRKIFQLIAEVSNLNFLIGDDVSGLISIKLVNVPWDQALDVILETKQLAMKRDGNIVQILQKSKMLSQEQEDKNAKDAMEMAMPLKTAIFDVNYAKIDDVEKQFKDLKSRRGVISKDSRTNRIIIKDIESSIDDMKFLLKNMDLPERQVMIEARIVEASSSFTRDLGVKWNVGYRDGSASFANINSADSSFGGVVSSVLPTSTTGGMATGMSFGKLASNVQLDMRLSAAATVGQVKVISTPKVMTLNNKKAKISQGQSVPYQTTSAEGTKTEFIEAVLTLEVTPHITNDGNVGMEIKASNNSVGSGTPPPINKKEATTELVVKNGETTVIGGIYIDSDTQTETGVPFLMDIPLLGWMFKSDSKSKNKTELLIFITPKVIN